MAQHCRGVKTGVLLSDCLHCEIHKMLESRLQSEQADPLKTTYDARPCWIEAFGALSGVKGRRDQLVVLV
jgi:hypothetical protein